MDALMTVLLLGRREEGEKGGGGSVVCEDERTKVGRQDETMPLLISMMFHAQGRASE